MNIYRRVRNVVPSYSSFQDMPPILVFLMLSSTALPAAYYAFALKEIIPEYINAANKAQEFGVAGFASGVMVLAMIFATYYCGEIALKCRAVLKEKWFS